MSRNSLFALTVIGLLVGCQRYETVSDVTFERSGIRCHLTWTGPITGWRLRTADEDGTFSSDGAVQKLAAFMSEPSPSRNLPFRVGVRDGFRICRADDGTRLEFAFDGTIRVFSSTGKVVTELTDVSVVGGRAFLVGRLLDEEPVYGLGERLDRLNKRGQKLTLFTTDGYNDSAATYTAIPLFTTHRGGGVFVNLYDRMTADFGATEKNFWRFEVDTPRMDVYLFAKDRIAAALEAYTALSGHADEPESWNSGPVICRIHPDLTRLEGPFVSNFRGMTLRGHGLKDVVERHMALGVKPTAVIVEGGGYVDLHSDSGRRAEFKRMADYLRKKDIKLMLYMRVGGVCSPKAPGFRPDFNVSVSISTNGIPAVADTKLIPDRRSKGINPDVGKGSQMHVEADITNPEFWSWYVNTVWRELVDLGVRGVKIDFCELMPEEGENPGGVGIHYKWRDPEVFKGVAVHHAYPTFFISRFYKEMSALARDRGGFMVLARGGGIGSQRNPFMWAGDQRRMFEKLDDQVLAMLNSGISGVPFMTYDMAGYQYDAPCVEPDGVIGDISVGVRRSRTTNMAKEAAVFRRGVEFTAFSPCVQSHGVVRNAYDFDADTQAHYRKFMGMHAALALYLAKYARLAAETGVPVVRPLVFRYPDDPKVWDIFDEYLLGDSILVAPVLGPEKKREVYLPKGDWRRVPNLELPVYIDGASADAANLMSALVIR